MFLGFSSLTYAPGLSRPSVLAMYSDHFIGEVRLKPILNALLSRGIIGSYQIVDRQVELVGSLKEHQFSHIWCQRNVSTAQFRFLRQHRHVPLIYDLDDLLTSPPEFVSIARSRTIHRIEWCLRNATVVTVTSERLAASLREDVSALTSDVIVIKNGCASASYQDVPATQRRLVWASNDRPYILKDDPAFVDRVAHLANREKFQAIFIGRFGGEHLKLFNDSHHLPYLDFVSYREFLRACAGGIGLAPLPTRLPERSQRFFDSKSDIKLVDFLSSGLLPICNDAVPYVTSDLFVPEIAGSDPDSLILKLEAAMTAPAAMWEHVKDAIHQPERLQEREFARLSMAMDRFFA